MRALIPAIVAAVLLTGSPAQAKPFESPHKAAEAARVTTCGSVTEHTQVTYDNVGETFRDHFYVSYLHCTSPTTHYDDVTSVKLTWETLEGNKPNCDTGAIYGGIDHFEGNVGALNGWNPGAFTFDCTTAQSWSFTYPNPSVPRISGSDDRCVAATVKVVNDQRVDKTVTLPTICVG